jgi:hypothetical protein
MGDYNPDPLDPSRNRPDLVAIKKSGTGTHSTEVHILDGASGFQNWLLQTGTLLPETDDTYDFVMGNYNVGRDRIINDRVADLVVIKKSGTGTHSTEVHILDGASGFQNWLLQTGTPLGETDDTWDFVMGDWYPLPGISDLIAIKKSATVTAEIHILEGPEWKEWINYSSSIDGKVWSPSMGVSSSEISMTYPLSLTGGSIVHIARPSLVKTPNGWRMWFDAKVVTDTMKEIVPQSYLAEAESLSPPSPRFRVIHKYDPLPSGNISFAAPDVARRPDGTYVAVLERDNSETLYLATSPNGITFTLPSEPVLRAGEPTLGQKKVHNPGLLYDQVNDQLLGLAFGMSVRDDYLDSKIGFSYTQYEIQIQSPDGTWHVFAEGDTLTDQSVLVFNYTEFEKVRLIDPVTGQILLEQDFTDAQVGDLYRLFLEPILVPCDTNALINAIDMANSNSEADLLSLAAGCTYLLTGVNNDTDSPNGLPSITSEIVINGNGATIERSDTAPDFRIFHVAAEGDLALNDLNIVNGQGVPLGLGGGGIFNRRGKVRLSTCAVRSNIASAGGGIVNHRGTVTLVNSIISDNEAITGSGGGISNADGTVTLTNSTVSDNIANGDGGGIYNIGFGNVSTVELSNSTLNDNSANGNGGGIFNVGTLDVVGTIELTNSTISGNTAGNGGGIYNGTPGILRLTNSTISSNRAGVQGGGIFNQSVGTVTLTNTLVAGQFSGGDCSGLITSNGHNLDSDGTCNLNPTIGDLPRTNPLLGPLQDNGGPTETHGLFASSPAIDAIPAGLCPATDQRGVPRPQGKGCDIGAFEFGETTNSCEIDLENDTHTCSGIAAIDFVQEPGNHEVVLKVNLDPNGPLGSTRAVFEVEYGEPPSGWTVNIGDSATNNGAGGDCATQSNDAELDIQGTTMRVFGFVDSGSLVILEISNERLDWDNHSGEAGNLVSPYLYALNGQPDTEGPVNYDIYAAFNRVITFDGCPPEMRRGSGVTHVTVTLRSEPTAITLLSFTAQAGADHVTLAWETGTEVNNAGFNLWRSEAADGPYTKINDALIPAEGDAVSGASYTYTDTDVVKGVTYYYKLEDVDIHGVSTFHGPVSATPGIQSVYLPLILK